MKALYPLCKSSAEMGEHWLVSVEVLDVRLVAVLGTESVILLPGPHRSFDDGFGDHTMKVFIRVISLPSQTESVLSAVILFTSSR